MTNTLLLYILLDLSVSPTPLPIPDFIDWIIDNKPAIDNVVGYMLIALYGYMLRRVYLNSLYLHLVVVFITDNNLARAVLVDLNDPSGNQMRELFRYTTQINRCPYRYILWNNSVYNGIVYGHQIPIVQHNIDIIRYENLGYRETQGTMDHHLECPDPELYWVSLINSRGLILVSGSEARYLIAPGVNLNHGFMPIETCLMGMRPGVFI